MDNFLKFKFFKEIKKKLGPDMWHALFTNITYLNTVRKKYQINQKLTKLKT